ncbi:helix-turn-helix domain-containing protein [Sinomicrobium sp. M5D2P17]
MIFRKFQPHPKLRDFILFYFELNWKKKSQSDAIKYLSIPTGCSFMGFQTKGRMKVQIDDYVYHTEEFYVNAQTTVPYYMFSSDDHLNVLVVCLKPTALYHLFQIDISQIVNTGINPKNLFYNQLDNFPEELLKRHTIEDKIRLLDTTFIEQLNTVKPGFNFIDIAINLILKNKGVITVEEIIAKLNVSKRYFQKKFKEIVGIQPSTYAKIIRYNFIFSSFKEIESGDCKSVASLFNFYDSPHYSKSFKEYLGMSPSEFKRDEYPFVKLTSIEQAVWTNAFLSLATH